MTETEAGDTLAALPLSRLCEQPGARCHTGIPEAAWRGHGPRCLSTPLAAGRSEVPVTLSGAPSRFLFISVLGTSKSEA